MSRLPTSDWDQVAIATPDQGTEVLWAEHLDEITLQLLSVPVFAYGVSRGTAITAVRNGNRYSMTNVERHSKGATVRCYFARSRVGSEVYLGTMVPEGVNRQLAFGPATFLDPDVVAIHLHDREKWQVAGAYFDDLARRGVVRFWELSDPEVDARPTFEERGSEYYELVHPLPHDPTGVRILAH